MNSCKKTCTLFDFNMPTTPGFPKQVLFFVLFLLIHFSMKIVNIFYWDSNLRSSLYAFYLFEMVNVLPLELGTMGLKF